jgi:glutathione S-transferase
MMLRGSPSSPFVRKVTLSAVLLGLVDRIESVNADTSDPNDPLVTDNPLGKIPVLVLDNGRPLYDSRVICEYLDTMAGGGVLFPAGEARWEALRLQALADGIIEAILLQILERRFRPKDKWHQPWMDRQQEKAARSLALLEAAPPALAGRPHIGHVTLACALGYIEFRQGSGWRAAHPKLTAWLEAFAAAVPAYTATIPQDWRKEAQLHARPASDGGGAAAGTAGAGGASVARKPDR